MSGQRETPQLLPIRRHLLLTGSFIVLGMLAIGVANEVFTSTWPQAVTGGLIIGLLALALTRSDRSTRGDKDQARRYTTIAMASSAVVALLVLAIGNQFTTAGIAVVLAAAGVAAVWIAITWWAGRQFSAHA